MSGQGFFFFLLLFSLCVCLCVSCAVRRRRRLLQNSTPAAHSAPSGENLNYMLGTSVPINNGHQAPHSFAYEDGNNFYYVGRPLSPGVTSSAPQAVAPATVLITGHGPTSAIATQIFPQAVFTSGQQLLYNEHVSSLDVGGPETGTDTHHASSPNGEASPYGTAMYLPSTAGGLDQLTAAPSSSVPPPLYSSSDACKADDAVSTPSSSAPAHDTKPI